MLKLMNFSTSSADMAKFKNDHNQIGKFLKNNKIDGLELSQYAPWSNDIIPLRMISGFHMSFWPVWLDFWNGNTSELIRQFGNMDIVQQYYGGESREKLVEYYRREIETAIRLRVEYVVCHVCHVQPEHCYNYRFTYTDDEVTEAFIELINEVTSGINAHFDLLFENLWWPGFTLKDRRIAELLLEKVNYSHKGFMLDTGHLMNTHTGLATEGEAVEYMMEVIDELDEISAYIQGIHLNSSLSGSYVRNMQQSPQKAQKGDFFEQYHELCHHVANIDRHAPFKDPSICNLIKQVNPYYLVYEFRTDSYEQLQQCVDEQNKALHTGWEARGIAK